MNVENPGARGVYVDGYGVVQAGKSAKVRDSKQVRELMKAGALRKSDTQNKEKTDDS